MENFKVLLALSAKAHGHLCPGQAVGVRMAMLGCRLIGLNEPTEHSQIKKLLVYVEMDRCAADAIAHVTGVKLGRRSLKFMDYGIMAATFVNVETGVAFRVLSTEEARELVPFYAPGIRGKAGQQLEAYRRMPDSVLFRVQQVQVPVSDCDLPGPTRYKAICSRCGQVVRDLREVLVNGDVLCRPCAHGAYFRDAREITWPDMNWTPASAGASHEPRPKRQTADFPETKEEGLTTLRHSRQGKRQPIRAASP
ncbi:MAG: FmdE family protein [Deltaproteobacteria bacterium]